MTDLTDSGDLLRMLYQAMLSAGIDADAVLKRLSLDRSILTQEELRTPHDHQKWFWQVAEEVSGDPHIGLHLGAHIPILKGQVLEYLFLSSPTFGEGIKRSLNYQRLLSDAFSAKLVEQDERIYLKQMMWSRKLHHVNECALVGVIKFFNYVTNGAFVPLEVHFNHKQHANQGEYERIFGCPVLFEQDDVQIVFDAGLMNIPSAHHAPGLLKLHEQFATEQVAQLERQDLVGQVGRLIAELLESGDATLEKVAARLGIKPRPLRTQLDDAGTTFNRLVSEHRCKLAKRLLAGTDESIDQIVYLTGFSEPSNFYRAFKRWVGMTPIEYRKRKAEQDSA